MAFRRILPLLLILSLLLPLFPAQAGAAAVNLTVQPLSAAYSFDLPKEDFVLLSYSTPSETGKMVLYSPNGHFEGQLCLQYSHAGGQLKVTVDNMKLNTVASGKAKLPADPGAVSPKGTATGKVSGLTLNETPQGISYAFSAPGTDYLMLYVRNKQESFTFPVYPDENGEYAGSVALPLTYARTLNTVQVQSAKGKVLAEAQCRKGYEAPPAAEQQPGRLTGVTVCIDPGHQENGHLVKEPLGPGLNGSTTGTSGMAQGTTTMRKESIVVLEIAMVVRDELLRQGANVVLTRERQDQFLTNRERCDAAENGGADIMLRLHADTRADSSKMGISVYGPLHSDYAKAVAEPAEYRAMGQTLLDAMKQAVGYPLNGKYGLVTLNDQFVGNNWAKMVCFLVECGYMSNPREDYLLSCPVYQQWLAEGIAQGVYEIAVSRGWTEAEEKP